MVGILRFQAALMDKNIVTIILPTYNERENISILIHDILQLPGSEAFSVLVVDDNSEDGTAEVVETIAGRDSRVSVLSRKNKIRGLVPSLNDGIKLSGTEIVLWMDADLQMPADRIPEFLRLMKQESVTAVIGSRFIPGGADIRDTDADNLSGVQRLLSSILSNDVPRILGIPMTDVTSGYIAIRKSFFSDYTLRGTHGEYFMDLIHRLHFNGHKVREIPYRLLQRKSGISKTTNRNLLHLIRNGARYIITFARLYLRS